MLDHSLTYHLACLAEDGIGSAETLFLDRFGLDVHQLRVLRLIDDRPDTTFTELAARTKFERSATSRILARLIKLGLVRRRIDADDARHFRLRATAKGKALRHEADPLSEELEAVMLTPLDARERAQFLDSLAKLNAWVETGYREEVQRKIRAGASTGRGARSEDASVDA